MQRHELSAQDQNCSGLNRRRRSRAERSGKSPSRNEGDSIF